MASEHGSDTNLNINQAATCLNVTDKTIRNYIDKGLLKAEKWNGSWRIHYDNILEIYYKKYGKKLEQSQVEQLQREPSVQISREEYDRLQQSAGRLEAAEILVKEMKSDQKMLNEKLAQLEGSSASGWTEARKYKEDLENLKNELEEARKQEKTALLEADWLRRELDRLREIQKEQVKAIQALEEKGREFTEDLKTKQEESNTVEKELRDLKAKYRRDSFLG